MCPLQDKSVVVVVAPGGSRAACRERHVPTGAVGAGWRRRRRRRAVIFSHLVRAITPPPLLASPRDTHCREEIKRVTTPRPGPLRAWRCKGPANRDLPRWIKDWISHEGGGRCGCAVLANDAAQGGGRVIRWACVVVDVGCADCVDLPLVHVERHGASYRRFSATPSPREKKILRAWRAGAGQRDTSTAAARAHASARPPKEGLRRATDARSPRGVIKCHAGLAESRGALFGGIRSADGRKRASDPPLGQGW
jgi:hypothetical protein